MHHYRNIELILGSKSSMSNLMLHILNHSRTQIKLFQDDDVKDDEPLRVCDRSEHFLQSNICPDEGLRQLLYLRIKAGSVYSLVNAYSQWARPFQVTAKIGKN